MTTSTVNVSFPRALLKMMDQVAKKESRSRSELLREAARAYVDRKRRWERLFSYWRETARRSRVTPGEIEAAVAQVRTQKRR